MSTEYRLILTKVLEQFDCSSDDILQVWDEAVEEAKEKLESIVQQFKPKSKRKKGKKNGPKRPKSAYIFFCQDKRPEVREQNPEMKATEVTKELGAMWNEIKETDDALEYINLAKKDKVRYNQELENTPAVTSEDDDQEKKKKKKKNKKDGPKKAKSAYIFFCQNKRPEVREQNPEMKATEVTKELGAMWNEIKATDDALEYVNLAKEDKVRYNEEMENAPVVTSEDDTEKPKKKKKKDGHKKAKSAYIFFCQDKRAKVREENSDMNPKEITAELGRLWNLIKGTNKAQKYIDMADEDKERYKNESSNEETKQEPKEKKKPKKQLPKKKEDKEEKPKKMSGYILFCKEKFDDVQEEFPTLKKKDIRAKLSEMWKDIKTNDKDTFGEYNMRAKHFYDNDTDVEYEVEPDASEDEENKAENEAKVNRDDSEDENTGEETKAQIKPQTKPTVLPELTFNNTQLDDDEELEDEVQEEVEAEAEEEDEELTGAKSLLELLNQVKVNKAKKGYKFNKDEFIQTTEALKLSDELVEKIATFKNGKKALTVSFLEDLITLSQETIESYN